MKIENISKLVVQNFGSNIAIGIISEDPEMIFNTFWNWGATTGEMNLDSSKFGWFWTQPKRFEKTVLNIMLNRLASVNARKFKGKKHGFLNVAKKLTKNFFKQIQEETFLPASSIVYKELSGE
jgi:hypothetical protein